MKLPITTFDQIPAQISSKISQKKQNLKISTSLSTLNSLEPILCKQLNSLKKIRENLELSTTKIDGDLLTMSNTFSAMNWLIKLKEVCNVVDYVSGFSVAEIGRIESVADFAAKKSHKFSENALKKMKNFIKTEDLIFFCFEMKLKNHKIFKERKTFEIYFKILALNLILENSYLEILLDEFIVEYHFYLKILLNFEKDWEKFQFCINRFILLDYCYVEYFISLDSESLKKNFREKKREIGILYDKIEFDSELFLFFDRTIEIFDFFEKAGKKNENNPKKETFAGKKGAEKKNLKNKVPYKKDISCLVKNLQTITIQNNSIKTSTESLIQSLLAHLNDKLAGSSLNEILILVKKIFAKKNLQPFFRFLILKKIYLFLKILINKLNADEILPFIEFVRNYEKIFKQNSYTDFQFPKNGNEFMQNITIKKLLTEKQKTNLMKKYSNSISKHLENWLEKIFTQIKVSYNCSDDSVDTNMLESTPKFQISLFKTVSTICYDNLNSIIDIDKRNEIQIVIVKKFLKFNQDLHEIIMQNKTLSKNNFYAINLEYKNKITLKKGEEEYLIAIINGYNLMNNTLRSLKQTDQVSLLISENNNFITNLIQILCENILNSFKNLPEGLISMKVDNKYITAKGVYAEEINNIESVPPTINDYFTDYSKVLCNESFEILFKTVNVSFFNFYFQDLNFILKKHLNFLNLNFVCKFLKKDIKILNNEFDCNRLILVMNYLESRNEQLRSVQEKIIQREGGKIMVEIVKEWFKILNK